jgi:hypothetical protein
MYKQVSVERGLGTNARFDPPPNGPKGGDVGKLYLEFCERGHFNRIVQDTCLFVGSFLPSVHALRKRCSLLR